MYNRKQEKLVFPPDLSHVFGLIVQMKLRSGSKKGNDKRLRRTKNSVEVGG